MHGSDNLLGAAAKQITISRCQQWLLVLLTGCAAAVMAFAINVGVEGLDKLRYSLAFYFIQPGGGFFLAWLVLCASSCAISTVAALGVVYISPLAAGSGIPHIKAYCNGSDIPGLLTLKTLVVKAVGAMFSIGSGLVAGKEGPFIQCGACIAHVISEGSEQVGNWHTSTGSIFVAAVQQFKQLCEKHIRRHASGERSGLPVAHNSADKELTAAVDAAANGRASLQLPHVGANGCNVDPEQLQLALSTASKPVQQDVLQYRSRYKRLQHDKAAMGAGAGVAAAVIAPLAGAAYSIEEASSNYSRSIFTQTFLVGGWLVFLLWVFTKASSAGGGALSSTMFQNPLTLAFRGAYGTTGRFWWYAWEAPLLLVLGVLGGLIMAAWTALNIKLQVARKAVLKARWVKVLDVVLCCLLTNSIRLLAAYMSPCVPVPVQADLAAWQEQIVSWQFFDAPSGMFPQLWCPDNTYSVYGQLFMQPVDVSVRTLFTFDATHNHTDIWNTWRPVNSSTAQVPEGAAAASVPEVDVFKTEAVVAYFVFTWGMLLLSYGISAPTGIFIPCLSAGAAGGRLAGHILQHTLRRAGIFLPICMPSWSVLGAAAMLTGCTRLAMSNCLIVLESSGAVQLVVPMAMLMIVAKLVADGLIIGIYDYQIEAAGYLFLPPADMMSSRAVAVMTHHKVWKYNSCKHYSVELGYLNLYAGVQSMTEKPTGGLPHLVLHQCRSRILCPNRRAQAQLQVPTCIRRQCPVTQATALPDFMNLLQPCIAGSSVVAVAGSPHATGAGFAAPASAAHAGRNQVECRPKLSKQQQPVLRSAAGASQDSQQDVVAQQDVGMTSSCSGATPALAAAPEGAAAGATWFPPPAATASAAAAANSRAAEETGLEVLASAALCVSANSSIHAAYTAMREFALEQLPVVLFPQSRCSSTRNCSAATADESVAAGHSPTTAAEQLVQHAGVQPHRQRVTNSSITDSAGSMKGPITARIVHTLHRKDMVPHVMLNTIKDKQE